MPNMYVKVTRTRSRRSTFAFQPRNAAHVHLECCTNTGRKNRRTYRPLPALKSVIVCEAEISGYARKLTQDEGKIITHCLLAVGQRCLFKTAIIDSMTGSDSTAVRAGSIMYRVSADFE